MDLLDGFLEPASLLALSPIDREAAAVAAPTWLPVCRQSGNLDRAAASSRMHLLRGPIRWADPIVRRGDDRAGPALPIRREAVAQTNRVLAFCAAATRRPFATGSSGPRNSRPPRQRGSHEVAENGGCAFRITALLCATASRRCNRADSRGGGFKAIARRRTCGPPAGMRASRDSMPVGEARTLSLRWGRRLPKAAKVGNLPPGRAATRPLLPATDQKQPGCLWAVSGPHRRPRTSVWSPGHA